MNNRKSLYFILPLIALVLLACRVGNTTFNPQVVQGSGNVVTEQRQVSGVERVTLTSIGDLTIIQGDEEGLTIEADDNLLPYIKAEMRGRELNIGLENGVSVRNISPIRYTLRIKDINRISVSGSGNIDAEELTVGDLTLSITGSGNVNIVQLTAGDLNVTTSGSGNYDLAGKVAKQEITITGSGNYRAGDLESTRASVQISGAGNVTVWAEEELDVRITGFGSVDYYGKPQVSQSISGSGSVNSQGNK
jgi:hypothetical protein